MRKSLQFFLFSDTCIGHDSSLQTSPVTHRTVINQNKRSNSQAAIDCIKYDEVVFDGMLSSAPGYGSDDNPVTAEIAWMLRLANKERTRYEGDIFTNVYLPIHDSFDGESRQVVAVMRVVLHWARYFKDILPDSTGGIFFVLDNHCDEPYTYRIDGHTVTPVGRGDLHESKYDKYMKMADFSDIDKIADGTTHGIGLRFDKCMYSIRVYPSSHMEDMYTSNTPVVITMSVAFVFAFSVLMFFAFDRLVERRQRILMDKAKRTHQIVASLFPKNIRDQILNNDGELHHNGILGAKQNLKSFMKGGMDADNYLFGQMPIADLYPGKSQVFLNISCYNRKLSSPLFTITLGRPCRGYCYGE